MGKKKNKRRARMGDRARRKAEKAMIQNSGGSYLNLPRGTEIYKPKKGTQTLAIVPYEVKTKNHPEADVGELWYQRDIYVHYNVGIDEKAVICPKTIGKSCPICKYLSALKKDPDADEEIIKALKPKHRELYNVINLDEDSDKVLLFEISYYNFGDKLDEEIREGKPEWADFAEVEEGFALSIRFKEKQLGQNKYLQASRIDFEERDDYTEEILEQAFDLDSLLNILSYDDIEKILHGEPEDIDDEDEEEEEKPSRRSSKRKKEETSDEDEEETSDDTSDDDDEDEEDEEEKPAKRSRRSKGKCPYGYKFGADVDNEDECENCKKWDDCMDAFEEAEKAKRKKK